MVSRCTTFGRLRHHLGLGKMRGDLGKGAALVRDGLEARARGFGLRDHAGAHDALKHAVARGARSLRAAVGPARLGRLRQRDEQRRLADRKAARLLAEIGERGRAHALDVAAERRKPQIEREDLPLRQMPLELQGAEDLAQLGGAGALVMAFDEACDLHGQRRATRDDVAVAHELPGRARERARIDAGVVVEAFVLERHEHGEVALVDLVGLDGEAASGPRAW